MKGRMLKAAPVLLVGMLIMMLAGCAKPQAQTEKKEYVRDTSPGKVVTISLDEMNKMLEKKQSFVVTFVKSDCPYCKDFDEMLAEYLKEHNITMHEVVLDKEPTSASENREIVQEVFPKFDLVPGVFYAKDGKMEDYIPTTEEDLAMENFDKWIEKHQLDNKN